MSRYVKSAMVVATLADKTVRYFYQGAKITDDVPAAEVQRLLDEGFLGDTDVEDPDAEGAKPREQWTIPQLQAYAEQHSIDLGDAKLKADILAAIDEGEKPKKV